MFERIVDILLEYKDVPREIIKPETRFLADLGFSSLDIMDMIGRLEDEYDVIVETDDLKNIVTVSDLTDYIGKLK